jgi:hypothetical protein
MAAVRSSSERAHREEFRRNKLKATTPDDPPQNGSDQVCRCIDWYAEGESKTLVLPGVRVIVRYVGRKGRRARICITAPAGALFLGDQDHG